MNWFDYLRGYEEGQYDGGTNSRYQSQGIILSLIILLISLALIAIKLCYYLLRLLYRLVKTILYSMTRQK